MEPNALPPSPSRLRSFLLLVLGIFIGAGLMLGGLWYHAMHGGIADRLAGVWTGTAEVAGTEVTLSLTLQEKEGNLSGDLIATPGGEGHFDQVKIDPDGAIAFSITAGGESVHFTGQTTPDIHSMSGKVTTTTYGAGTWTLSKQS